MLRKFAEWSQDWNERRRAWWKVKELKGWLLGCWVLGAGRWVFSTSYSRVAGRQQPGFGVPERSWGTKGGRFDSSSCLLSEKGPSVCRERRKKDQRDLTKDSRNAS